MHRARLTLAVAAASIAIAGCGQDSSKPAKIDLWSPAVQANGFVAPNVRCGGGTLWLPMKWGPIPADTEELLLYFGRFAHADPQRPEALEIPFGSVFPEVDLDARSTEANAYPPGSTPHYYTLNNCVPTPAGQKYVAALFALDEPVSVPNSLNAAYATRITEEALGFENPATDSKPAETLIDSTLAMDSFAATYGKPR